MYQVFYPHLQEEWLNHVHKFNFFLGYADATVQPKPLWYFVPLVLLY